MFKLHGALHKHFWNSLKIEEITKVVCIVLQNSSNYGQNIKKRICRYWLHEWCNIYGGNSLTAHRVPVAES